MMKKNIKWLQYSISIIVSILTAVSIFNYKIDSLGLFGNSNYLSQAAKTLTSGKMIAGLKNNDERLFQELIIKNLQVKNDVIAIGSSRTMELRKRVFLENKINFFNHSVSGASLEDYISIIGAYELIHGYTPSTVVLGIDPWVFNKYNGQNRWKSLIKYYNYEIEKIYNKKQNTTNINTTKWKQLINYDYTIANMRFYKTLLENEGKSFYITDTIDIDDSIKEVDGSIHYPYETRYIKANNVRESAIQYSKKPVYALERFNELDNIKLFKDFIKYLQSRNVKVVFFLPPYNPITYDLLMKQQEYQILDKVEKYLITFANEHNIEIKGSYNPHKYSFENKDFYDGMHGHDKVIKKIFNHSIK